MIYLKISEEQAREFAREGKVLWACARIWDPKQSQRARYDQEPVKGRLFFQSFGTEIKFFPERTDDGTNRKEAVDYRVLDYADTEKEANAWCKNLEETVRKQHHLPERKQVYNRKTGTQLELPSEVAAFCQDLEAVCKKHGYQFEADLDTLVISPWEGHPFLFLSDVELYL